MSITFPKAVIVSAKTIIMKAYALAILAVMVWGPLIALHGYRQWWVDIFYAAAAIGTTAGIISHYRIVRRKGKC